MKKFIKIAVISFIIIGFISVVSTVNSDEYVKSEMENINNQVAKDLIEQYQIAKKTGNKMDAYMQASTIAQAFLAAKDEANYKKWTAIAKEEEKALGY